MENRRFTSGSWIVEAYRFIRDFLAFPDMQVGWIPFACRAGLKTIRANHIQAIIVAVNNFSSCIIGYLLARKTCIPYLLDFRDGWTDDPFLIRPTSLHRWGHSTLEKLIVGNADQVVTWSNEQAELFRERYPQLQGHLDAIYNGFDPADFSTVIPKPRLPGFHRIVLVGTLQKYHEKNVGFFIEALKIIPKDIASTLELVFVGHVYEKAAAQFAAANLSIKIEFIGYSSHSDGLGFLESADAALLFLVPGDISSFSGKVFEYLASGKPILACIEPDGLLAQVLRQEGQGDWIAPPNDPNLIAKAIVRLAAAGWPKPERSNLEVFDRKQNTKRLAAILDRMVED